MNGYTPSDNFAVTDGMAAEEQQTTVSAAEQAAETVQEQPAEGENTAAEPAETTTDTQPTQAEEPTAQAAKGGPNETFAQQRRLIEQAEQTARTKLFEEMTSGMTNPATGKPFAGMEEWKGWREETRLQQLARETGQTVEAVRQAEEAATARAREQLEASPEYQRAKQAEQAMRQQMMQMQFAQDMAEIKAAYPGETADSVEALGETYIRLRAAGIDNMTAYKVLQTQAAQSAAAMPPSTGDVKPTADTRRSDFYTKEELESMSGDEMDANWDKVMASMKRLPRR